MSRKTHKAFRGQSAESAPIVPCVGRLTIVLRGPQGVGKSLVVKVLKALLPLLPLDEVSIVEEQV